MDSDDPQVGDPLFATAAEQSKSRITDQLTLQKKQQATARRSSALKSTSVHADNLTAPTKQTARATPKFSQGAASITRSAALQNVNRRMEKVIDRTPALKLNESNISRVRTLVVFQSFVIFVLVATFAYATLKLNDKNIYVARGHQALQLNTNLQRIAGASDDAKDPVRILTPMNAPTYTQAAVLSWAASTATSIMNFGFHNADEVLGAAKVNFTDQGWKSFLTALQDSKILTNIVAKEQVITAAPIGAPVIVRATTKPDKTHVWIVQIPFTVTTLSGKQTLANKRVMTMTITQVPPTRNLTGLSIDNWIES